MYVELDNLDLTEFVRAGDLVCWGQAQSEPVCLTEKLRRQSRDIGAFSVFLGISTTSTALTGWADEVRFFSFCGTGTNRKLFETGRLDILPSHYTALNRQLQNRVDVVMLQVAEHPDGGRFSLSVNSDYLANLVKSARVVIAEVNEFAPYLCSTEYFSESDFTILIRSRRALGTLEIKPPSRVEQDIGANVASLVSDGATLQFGIGSLPGSIAAALQGHRNLGLHTGILSDGAMDLLLCGAADNSRKNADQGISVTGAYMGSKDLLDFAHLNSILSMRPIPQTHELGVIASMPQFTAINSAIEVDLTGQINTEIAGGKYVGTVGGSVDFTRGALASPGGIAIVAMPSTVGKGGNRRSRIVPNLSGPASVARSDTCVVVTEFGIADLRGLFLGERVGELIKIAHPDYRDALTAGSRRQS